MNAGFFRRAFSALFDLVIVLSVVYLSFLIAGEHILQNQIDDFDEIFSAYNEVVDAYEADLAQLTADYDAAVILAASDEALETAAYNDYVEAKALLDTQNTIDIEPYNDPLSQYYFTCIIYFIIGFMVLMSIYTLATTGRTLGRKILRVRLDGPAINPVTVFFHDIVLKYFLVILVFVYSVYAGVALFLFLILVDFIMITVTGQKRTLRDLVSRVSVIKAEYAK